MKYKYDIEMIIKLSDGFRYASDIARIVKCPAGYVRKLWAKNPEIPRPKACSPRGPKNHAWKGGRVIQRCGRVLVPAPENHPYARVYSNKKIGRILEHRLVMENMIGRHLKPEEVVDHIDECVLHNDKKNLRLFANNQEHLKATIRGVPKDLSYLGRDKLRASLAQRKEMPEVSNYHDMWRIGDFRLLQILHAHVLLDKDSPYLLNTHRYLTARQIDYSCEKTIKDNLVALCHKWALRHRLSRLKHLL